MESHASEKAPDEKITFIQPQKLIKQIADMAIWEKSEALMEYTGFIATLNEAVKGKPNSVDCKVSEVTKNLVTILDKLEQMMDLFPPTGEPQRFGNIAFRDWFGNLRKESTGLLEEVLQDEFYPALIELKVYFEESFGNPTRIDYGTGHEISFIMFLCCLYKIGALNADDHVATVVLVFNKYLKLVRELQIRYRMEPAGSHGVWSLDDYQFVPFIWGSSQLVDQPRIYPPSKFLDNDILNKFSEEYMFLSCIQYINKVKKGPFAEHSNQLWNCSAVGSWHKINQGLIKMYKKEVLEKFPVVQHIYFGSIMPIRKFVRKN